ncbi:MAG: MBL fold metallo-hydrolase [Selenomonadaceae bacterium]|nr:MBL fold metallo-hydrolase [Selenomonadaceae bacterium]
MDITYLLNSGFLIRDDRTLLIFDDFEDPANVVDKIVKTNDFDSLYIFVSHAHFDHFGTHIRAYAHQTTRYIFSYDLKHTKRIKIFPQNNITLMKRYTEWQDDNIKVWTYDSTDVGVSFLVETSTGKRIFHAGDFNWWHWEGDTAENNTMAERMFKKQLKRMVGMEADVAFFPVDGRLGNSQEMGAKEFVAKTNIKYLIAMHRVNYPKWQPSEDFFGKREPLPVWAPVKSGESITIANYELRMRNEEYF